MQPEPREDGQVRFRFSGGGYPCPYCHSRTGWSWIRNYGKEYGLCFACGRSNYPERGSTAGGSSDPAGEHYTSTGREGKGYHRHGHLPVRCIPLEVMEKTLTAYQSNPFVQFLENSLGREAAGNIVSHMRIGTARNGGTVFWYFDRHGFCRKPKVVFYGPDGHRIKNDPQRKPHCAGYTNAKGYTLPLYGEQQLNPLLYSETTPVVLVESEKTACIGYGFLPEYIWLATGGAGSLNHVRAAALASRQVIILPDADPAGREGAHRCLRLLEKLGTDAQVRDLFPNRDDNTDLADYLLSQLRENSPDFSGTAFTAKGLPLARPFPQAEMEKIEMIFSKQPLLRQLSGQLDLEITGVKHQSKPASPQV